jgi:hypothetical protein
LEQILAPGKDMLGLRSTTEIIEEMVESQIAAAVEEFAPITSRSPTSMDPYSAMPSTKALRAPAAPPRPDTPVPNRKVTPPMDLDISRPQQMIPVPPRTQRGQGRAPSVKIPVAELPPFTVKGIEPFQRTVSPPSVKAQRPGSYSQINTPLDVGTSQSELVTEEDDASPSRPTFDIIPEEYRAKDAPTETPKEITKQYRFQKPK